MEACLPAIRTRKKLLLFDNINTLSLLLTHNSKKSIQITNSNEKKILRRNLWEK